MIENLLEDLHNFTLIRGDEYDALSKKMEASQHRFEVQKMTGFDMETSTPTDSYVDELHSRKHEGSELHEKMKAWS